MVDIFDPLDVIEKLSVGEQNYLIYSLEKLLAFKITPLEKIPYSIKVLLESVLRNVDETLVTKEDVLALANWNPQKKVEKEIPYMPARVVLQDFTGVPAVVDLAAMRSSIERFGKDPASINPLVPVDLVIDHSIQIDFYGSQAAREKNEAMEFERNKERYMLLRWAQEAFDNFRVVPPGRGIVHQVNLEYLGQVVQRKEANGSLFAYPDTLVGTDSHTTMINGLGILGWGVGGIEAEAVMLGQPYYMPIPDVIGVRLTGELRERVTATDLVLVVTEMLRKYGVVGKFVEFFGPGYSNLTLPDRATISNMSPEYGATCGFFPIDDKTLEYLKLSGRSKEQIALVEKYAKKQGLFYNPEKEATYTDVLELDLSTVDPSLAGPIRPQDRILLSKMQKAFRTSIKEQFGQEPPPAKSSIKKRPKFFTSSMGERKEVVFENSSAKKDKERANQLDIQTGSIMIAAITSCTNTSNPSVLLGAGLLAKKAVELGLSVKPFVKTSLAPGSRVVTDYLRDAGLLPYLQELGFHIVGYGCTTCIGNSGPLRDEFVKTIQEQDLVVCSILSGNRNFEGRISPYTKANYLASPILVVAYALAGTIDIDLTKEPLGISKTGKEVFLMGLWPKKEEIDRLVKQHVKKDFFKKQYAEIFKGTQLWNDLMIPSSKSYQWDDGSTYIREPPFFVDFPKQTPKLSNIKQARVLAVLGDTITTDHISPAGAIPEKDPAGQYLIGKSITPKHFNSFGSRRGNHEVMMRGTFGNIRLRNKLTPSKEGGWTRHLPTNEVMPIYDASMKYQEKNTPLIVLAGKEYGTGSSRDWAAKGTQLLGVKAVIAVSYERIHRSNLVGMGVLPLEFIKGQTTDSLKLTGEEVFDISGVENITPGKQLQVVAKRKDGSEVTFNVLSRLDSKVEIEYYQNGGILHTVLRKMIAE